MEWPQAMAYLHVRQAAGGCAGLGSGLAGLRPGPAAGAGSAHGALHQRHAGLPALPGSTAAASAGRLLASSGREGGSQWPQCTGCAALVAPVPRHTQYAAQLALTLIADVVPQHALTKLE